MNQSKGYVNAEYLQSFSGFVKHLKQRSYDLMRIQSGQTLLDVGCGPATDTIYLAQLVGQTGKVFGVDYDQGMIEQAEQGAIKAGVAGWVEHKQADASELPFGSDMFDACRSERVFQHLPEPDKALAEMTRVTKAGGWIVVLDTDWGSISIDTDEFDIERRLARIIPERCMHNGYSGRQLNRLFKQQGLVDIAIEIHPLVVTDYAFARQGLLIERAEQIAVETGIVTADELQRWHTSLERAASEGLFFGYGAQLMAVGRKPLESEEAGAG